MIKGNLPQVIAGAVQANTPAWATEGCATSSESHVVASNHRRSNRLAVFKSEMVLRLDFHGQTTTG